MLYFGGLLNFQPAEKCESISFENQNAVNNNENEGQELQHIIENVSI